MLLLFLLTHIFKNMKTWFMKTKQKIKKFNGVLPWDLKTKRHFFREDRGWNHKLDLGSLEKTKN